MNFERGLMVLNTFFISLPAEMNSILKEYEKTVMFVKHDFVAVELQ